MWVSIREAAVIYKVTVRTIREWIRSNKVESHKLSNGRWQVWIKENTDEDKG